MVGESLGIVFTDGESIWGEMQNNKHIFWGQHLFVK